VFQIKQISALLLAGLFVFLGCGDEKQKDTERIDSKEESELKHSLKNKKLMVSLEKSTPIKLGLWQENDLGYKIQVNKAYLSTYSVEALACDFQTSCTDKTEAPFFKLGIYQGHSSCEQNPFKLKDTWAEDLSHLSSNPIGQIYLDNQKFCSIYLLFARLELGGKSQSKEIEMTGKSLYLEGFYQDEGGMKKSFKIESSFSYGTWLEFNQFPEITKGSNNLSLKIFRNFNNLFKKVDFKNMNSWQIERTLFQNITESTSIKIEKSLP